MWGYELDPYVEPDLINKSIMKARIPLRESMLLQAVGSIMKDAVHVYPIRTLFVHSHLIVWKSR